MHWNYLVHGAGPKRVLLAPPSDAWRLAIHPRLHPSRRSSPVDLRRPWAELTGTWPQLEGAKLLRAGPFAPGDVLLIPPFWLHFISVGRDAPATSFSFFSDCAESEIARARAPPPRSAAAGATRAVAMLDAYFENGDPTAKSRGGGGGGGGGGGARALARRFLETRVLLKSLRSSQATSELFCKPRAEAAAARLRCPEARGARDEASVGAGRALGALARDAVADPFVGETLLVSHLEDLALDLWGPLDACAGLELCVLPLLSDAPAGALGGLVDERDECAAWAARGECTANPGYMRASCKKSCAGAPAAAEL